MTIQEEQINALNESTIKAARLIREIASEEKSVYMLSHLDADGLAAASIMAKALFRSGVLFHVRIQQWIDQKTLEEILAKKPSLTILTDLGSGYLELLTEKLVDYNVIILDHHQPIGEASDNFIHVNPHLYGIDGSRDLSGAGIAYLVAKALDKNNVDLACMAIVGSLGDLQDKYNQRALGGINEIIVKDAVQEGYLTVEKDPIFFGRETRPIHKALANTTSPFIPGISGEEDKAAAFLMSLGIKLKEEDKWRALRDLSEDEKTRLCSSLADYLISKGFSSNVLSLVGYVYTLVKEEPWTPLRDAREFAVLLNATGRMDKPSLGIAVGMGDRSESLEEAMTVLEEYRRTITKYMSWLFEDPNRIEELENIYVVRGEKTINDKIIGTLSSILSMNLPKQEKPVVAYAIVPEEGVAKVSARTVDLLTYKGVNLGEVMRLAAEKFSGRGGGHNVAAGAQVPIENIESFMKLVDKLVKEQLTGEPSFGS